MKKRKGAALVMALIVAVVGALLIAAAYNMVIQHRLYTEWEQVSYVDHTTLASELQAMKGRIISSNIDNGAAQHTPALRAIYENPAYDNNSTTWDGTLGIDGLRFGGWREEREEYFAGEQRILVEVFDMCYNPDWINPAVRYTADFPPSDGGLNAYWGGISAPTNPSDPDPAGPAYSGESQGDTTSADTGNKGSGGGASLGGDIRDILERYGVYMVRASVFEDERLSRRIEEVFVQQVPQEDEED